MPSIEVPKKAIPFFRKLGELGEPGITELSQELEQTAQPLRASELYPLLEKYFSEDAHLAVQQLVAMYSAKRASNLSAAVFTKDLVESLVALNLDPKLPAQWPGLAESFASLLSISTLETLAKINELSFEHQNVLTKCSLLTDVRPVFNDDGTRILAAVVAQTLLVEFNTGDSSKLVELALDERDVIQLRDACTRAISKAEAAKALMTGNAIPSIVTGGRDE